MFKWFIAHSDPFWFGPGKYIFLPHRHTHLPFPGNEVACSTEAGAGLVWHPCWGSWCVPLPCIRSFHSFTHTHQFSHAKIYTYSHTHTHTDLHLLPLCATSVHLIDDAASLSLSNTHAHANTHPTSSSLFSFYLCPLSCTLSSIVLYFANLFLPCSQSAAASSAVCVRLHMRVWPCPGLDGAGRSLVWPIELIAWRRDL